jgi:hypothetical protein
VSVQQAGLGWEEFTTQLARAIRELPDRGFLVVQDGATHAYVQFAAAAADAVAAEVESSSSQEHSECGRLTVLPAHDRDSIDDGSPGPSLVTHRMPGLAQRATTFPLPGG